MRLKAGGSHKATESRCLAVFPIWTHFLLGIPIWAAIQKWKWRLSKTLLSGHMMSCDPSIQCFSKIGDIKSNQIDKNMNRLDQKQVGHIRQLNLGT